MSLDQILARKRSRSIRSVRIETDHGVRIIGLRSEGDPAPGSHSQKLRAGLHGEVTRRGIVDRELSRLGVVGHRIGGGEALCLIQGSLDRGAEIKSVVVALRDCCADVGYRRTIAYCEFSRVDVAAVRTTRIDHLWPGQTMGASWGRGGT